METLNTLFAGSYGQGYHQFMTTSKQKFPVAEFPIRGGVLKQTQRNALVRSAMASVSVKKVAAKKRATSPAPKSKGK